MDELPDVRIGDIWQDNDPRGGPTVSVEKTCGADDIGCPSSHLGPHVHVTSVMPDGRRLRPRTIYWRRFRPGRSGYHLIERKEQS